MLCHSFLCRRLLKSYKITDSLAIFVAFPPFHARAVCFLPWCHQGVVTRMVIRFFLGNSPWGYEWNFSGGHDEYMYIYIYAM